MSDIIKVPLTGSIFVDQEGNKVNPSTVIDDEGNAVIRFVNSAPAAYDDESDALRVLIVQGGESVTGNRFVQPFSVENSPAGEHIEYTGIVSTGTEARLAVRWTDGSPSNYKVTARYRTNGDTKTLVKEETLIEADDGKNLADATFKPLTSVFDLRIYNEGDEDKELRVAEI